MKFLTFIIAAFSIMACAIEPEDIHYGKDSCDLCKMTIVDTKFGAEIVTSKGKIYKFDDVNCLVQFMTSGKVKENDIAHLLVIDFSKPEKLIDAKTAFYVSAESVKSPMASRVAAFADEKISNEYQQKWEGKPLTWSDIKKMFE